MIEQVDDLITAKLRVFAASLVAEFPAEKRQ